jgi:hypothetical protein
MNFVHESWTPKFPSPGVSGRPLASACFPAMEHGPQLHGILLGVIALTAIVVGLVYLVVRRVKDQRRSDPDPAAGRNPDASDRSREP